MCCRACGAWSENEWQSGEEGGVKSSLGLTNNQIHRNAEHQIVSESFCSTSETERTGYFTVKLVPLVRVGGKRGLTLAPEPCSRRYWITARERCGVDNASFPCGGKGGRRLFTWLYIYITDLHMEITSALLLKCAIRGFLLPTALDTNSRVPIYLIPWRRLNGPQRNEILKLDILFSMGVAFCLH